MSHFCFAKSVHDLLACSQCGDHQICCKECFPAKHMGQVKAHSSQKLVDSDVYKNFLKIIHVEWLVGQKLLKSLGGWDTVQQSSKTFIVNNAYYGSQFYQQLFQSQNSPTSQQYVIFKTLYSGQPVQFQTLNSLQKVLNGSKFLATINKYISKLIQMSEQQKIMNSHLDFYTGADSYYLAQFVVHEQQLFWEHYKQYEVKQVETSEENHEDQNENKHNEEKPEQKYDEKNEEKPAIKQNWTIYKYIEWRQKESGKERNPIYYSNQFTAFLVEYYRKNSEQKSIYTIEDYINNYWEFFQSVIHINPTIKTFFEAEVNFYRIYEKMMAQNNLFITYLGFKIWKLSNGVSKQIPYLKNHYFLFAFIQGYIKMLIERTYSFLKQEQKNENLNQSWQDFVSYIKQYSIFVQEKKQVFNFDEYKIYYFYRKKMEPFLQVIKSSKQNIFDKKVATKFLNYYFENPTQLKPKHYKEFLQKHQQQQKEKHQLFLKLVEQLKKELANEEKDNFLEFVYINFISYCQQQQMSITKQNYKFFKQHVKDTMDQTYLRQTEEKFQRGDFNEAEQEYEQEYEEEQQKVIIGETGAKITMGINQYEEQILENDLNEQKASQSEDEQRCPCCHGNSEDCMAPDCKSMGFCVTCNL